MATSESLTGARSFRDTMCFLVIMREIEASACSGRVRPRGQVRERRRLPLPEALRREEAGLGEAQSGQGQRAAGPQPSGYRKGFSLTSAAYSSCE